MRQPRSLLSACLAGAVILLVFAACPQKSPEEKIVEARGKYSLEPSGILVNELEPEPEPEEAGAAEAVAVAAEAAVAAEEAEEGGEMAEEIAAPEGPRTVEVMFDLLVRFNDNSESLPGITVDFVHTDPSQNEKARHLLWVETPNLRKGDARQVPVRLEFENYEDGDQFSVEFKEYVPPEERGDYREFAEAGG